MGELTFVDELPPQTGRTSTAVMDARLAEYRSQPGRWAMWPAKTSPHALRRSIAGKGFEVAQRHVDGKPRAFVRYVGEKADEAPPAASEPPGAPAPPLRSLDPVDPTPAATTKDAGWQCHACAEPITGETRAQALGQHRREHPTCDAILRRRR